MEFQTPRNATHRVHVGKVPVGGGAPVSVQSMTNVPMVEGPNGPWLDVAGNLVQIERLAKAGCEIVRVAIPNRDSIARFGQVAAASPLPVVADVHFDYQIAMGACHEHAAGLRINPGNIGSMEKVDTVIEAAGEAGIPIRIVSMPGRSKTRWPLATISRRPRSSRSRPRASSSISASAISMTSSSPPRPMT